MRATLASTAEGRIHPRCDLLLTPLKYMPVGVRGQHDRAVAEEVLDVIAMVLGALARIETGSA